MFIVVGMPFSLRPKRRFSLGPWMRGTLLTSATVSALLATMAWLKSDLAMAPEQILDHPLLSAVDDAKSLDDLYAVRSQLQARLEETPRPQSFSINATDSSYVLLSQLTYGLTQKIARERDAAASLRLAQELGEKASQQPEGSDLKAQLETEKLWKEAIASLDAIDEGSMFYDRAQTVRSEYATAVAPLSQRIDQQQSAFLEPIAAERGRASDVRIAVCQLDSSECRSYRGNEPPASLASLVKLPMAIALMHKVNTEDISLDDEIYIEPANFTENAQGSKIFVDRTYTLREVMVRMITESNNIATNQLADYIGFSDINQALKAEGYGSTTIGHKLVGDSTFPKFMGSGKNRSTANELTQMMKRIYSFSKASDEEILNGLVGQYDLEFGYTALTREKPNIFWIGEKTGQNSLVIGSSMAFKVKDDRYVMTVTIDRSAHQGRLKQIIRDVARAILEMGSLEEQGLPQTEPATS